MHLENIVVDCADPVRLGAWWAEALGLTVMHEDADLVEARLSLPPSDGQPGPWLDLCFGRVPEPPGAPQRLHLDLSSQGDQAGTVERLVGLGARHADIGQGDVPWVVLADPEGTPFCVLDDRPLLGDTGPIAALPLDVADPEASAAFWLAASGWQRGEGYAPVTLRHPSGRGPALELCPEVEPRRGKARMHLDVRPDDGDDGAAVVDRLLALGGSRVQHDWGPLSWTVLADPSGNEVCVLGVGS